MGSPMTFLDFQKTVDQNKIHFVSGKSVRIKGYGVAFEPAYALESSGSRNSKVFIHCLSSIEKACEAFFKTFKMDGKDRWGLCLSTAHVAGFSVLTRSYFGKLKEPHVFSWSKEFLISEIEKNNVSILSLVPTQIFDLVKMRLQPPKCLRMVFVGGAKLSSELREEASKLGWPLVDCYGSTETFAQMSYSLDGKALRAFDGWSLKLLEDGELSILGPGLFIGQIREGVYRSRTGEWFKTGDLAEVNEDKFLIRGKKAGLVKIKGSYFDFNKLKLDFQNFLIKKSIDPSRCFLACLAEKRDGVGIYIISTSSHLDSTIIESFSEIRGVFYLESVERSALGKIKLSSLSNVLQKTVLSL